MAGTTNSVAKVKKLLGDEADRIPLQQAVAAETRRVIGLLTGDRFTVGHTLSKDQFRSQIAAYDEVLSPLLVVSALLAWWTSDATRSIATLPLRRLCDYRPDAQTRTSTLDWYPPLAILYASGVSAVAAQRFDTLAALMLTEVDGSRSGAEPAVAAIVRNVADLSQGFEMLPGLESKHVPRSEHLFSVTRPVLEELFFLSTDYERAFDVFEVLLALEYGERTGRDWLPVGRFGWKAAHGWDTHPFQRLQEQARSAKKEWPPLRAGLFSGSFERFEALAERLNNQLRSRPML